jgi:hypothetical protein
MAHPSHLLAERVVEAFDLGGLCSQSRVSERANARERNAPALLELGFQAGWNKRTAAPRLVLGSTAVVFYRCRFTGFSHAISSLQGGY